MTRQCQGSVPCADNLNLRVQKFKRFRWLLVPLIHFEFPSDAVYDDFSRLTFEKKREKCIKNARFAGRRKGREGARRRHPREDARERRVGPHICRCQIRGGITNFQICLMDDKVNI